MYFSFVLYVLGITWKHPHAAQPFQFWLVRMCSDPCAASLTGSPEGSLWCSVLCWSKDGTSSWAVAFCWVCVTLATGRDLRNGLPESSGHPRHYWGIHRARTFCRNCCSRPVGEKQTARWNIIADGATRTWRFYYTAGAPFHLSRF